MSILTATFFNTDACTVAKQLLGKVIRRKFNQQWLAARIIETEAYYLEEKGSHDSLNISCQGKGNAVLIKSAFPYLGSLPTPASIATMQSLNSHPSGKSRPLEKLCNGQTLLCRALNLKVTDWDQHTFDPDQFYIEDVHTAPETIIQTTRLGIPLGRDELLPYRFIDHDFVKNCHQCSPIN